MKVSNLARGPRHPGICLLAAILVIMPIQYRAWGEPQWQLYKPSNTGIPGGQVQFCSLDPEDFLWVSAYDPFWEEGGIAKFDRVQWTTYSNLDSPLPTERIFDVDYLPDGTTWLGTDIGLVRFNRFTGSDWTTYTPANSPLPAPVIFSLDLDATGRLWAVYWDPNSATRGVAMFDGTNWQTWSPEQIGLGLVELDNVAVDASNNIWVGTRYVGGLAKYDGSTWTIFNASTGYSDYPAKHLTLGDDGNLWTFWEGLKMFNGTSWISKPELPDEESVITVLSDGTYWLGTYSGIVGYYNGGSWTLYEYNLGYHVYSIEIDQSGTVWCAGNDHLKRLNPDGSFTTFNNRNTGLTEYFVNDFGYETNGVVWFATGQGGICAFDGTIWRGFNPDNDGFEPWPFDTNGAEQVDVAPDGDVWVNAVVAIGQWDGQTWTEHLPGYWIEEMTVDPSGGVWVAPYPNGVGHYTGTSWETISSPTYYDPVFLKAGPDGRVWMGFSTGVMVYDGLSWTTYSPDNSGLPSMFVYDIAFDPDGSVWIATYEGLTHYDGISWTTYTSANSGLRVNNVLSVAVRDDGLVSAGTFRFDVWPYIGGVSLFDGETWETFTTTNSPLQHEQVESLAFDAEGRLWISSMSEGVAVVTLETPASIDTETVLLQSPDLVVSPNPFRSDTWVHFRLPETTSTTLRLFDVQGRLVTTPMKRTLTSGEQALHIDGRSLSPGVYFYRLDAGTSSQSGRLMRVR